MRNHVHWRAFALLPAIAMALPSALFAQEAAPSFTRLDYMASMRDGAKLATTAYVPAGEGPWPVILSRTPYNKEGRGGSAAGRNAIRDASRSSSTATSCWRGTEG